MAVRGVISLKDNATAVLRQVRQEQSAFRKDVEATKKSLSQTWDKKRQARLDAAPATKAMQALRVKLEPLRKKVVTAVALKDMATAKVKSAANKVKAFGKMAAAPVLKIKDQVSAGLSKVTGALKSIAKKVVIPVTIAATVAGAAITGAVAGGMDLEKQQVSMQHFIDINNQDKDEAQRKQISSDYLKSLRENANETPFETNEVIQAGTRSVGLTGGDTAAAMELVKVAEDMAALTPGSTIMDAMEALADAKNGETERLKGFNAKVSADEMKSLGFEGVVNERLKTQFDGGASKLATTGSGLLSTITGKLKSNFTDFGLKAVEQLKPAFETVITLIDKTGPIFEKFGGQIADGIGKGITFVSGLLPGLMGSVSQIAPAIQSIASGFAPAIPQLLAFGQAVGTSLQQAAASAAPVIQTIVSTAQSLLPTVMPMIQTVTTGIITMITQAAPIISGLVSGIGTVISTLAPVFTTIFGSIADKVGSVLSFVGDRMGWIQEVIQTAMPVVSDILTTAWGVIEPIIDIACNVFKVLFNVVQKIFPGIQKVITTVWDFIKPIVEGIGSVLTTVSDGVSWLADKFTGGDGGAQEPGANANGTNNWRGGLTWVGERGPELIDVPRGTRILPTKESLRYASEMQRPQSSVSNTPPSPANGTGGFSEDPTSPNRDSPFRDIERAPALTVHAAPYLPEKGHLYTPAVQALEPSVTNILPFPNNTDRGGNGLGRSVWAGEYRSQTLAVPPVPMPPVKSGTDAADEAARSITITLAKVADTVIVKDAADIDSIGKAVAEEIKKAVANM